MRPLLFLSSTSLPNRDEILCTFFESAAGSVGADNCDATRSRRDGDGGGTSGEREAWRRKEVSDEVGTQGRRRWLLILARFMARPREFELRREAAVRAFTPQKFRQEWELFWNLIDPMFDAFDRETEVSWRCLQEGPRG